MNPRAGTFAREGMVFGLLAGCLYGAADMIASASSGHSPLRPLQRYASLASGPETLASTSLAVIMAGVFTHCALATVFGYLYVLLVARAPAGPTKRYGWEAGLGTLFGLALWFVNYRLVARTMFPWMLDTPDLLQAALHAGLFGLPLGLMLAAGERREADRNRLVDHPV